MPIKKAARAARGAGRRTKRVAAGFRGAAAGAAGAAGSQARRVQRGAQRRTQGLKDRGGALPQDALRKVEERLRQSGTNRRRR